MKSVETTGKTVEEAVEKALTELQVGKGNANINVLAEPAPGFLGFLGTREARVRVTIKQSPDNFVPEFLGGLLQLLGIRADVLLKTKIDNTRYYQIKGKDLGVLIGRRGQTLNSLQYLVNIAFRRNFDTGERIILDIENYRQKRERTLERLARAAAEDALRTGKAVTMESMSPQERRIIHMALTGNNKIETYSTGEEPNRKVVIAPK